MGRSRFRRLWTLALGICTGAYLLVLTLLMALARALGFGRVASAMFIGAGAAVLVYAAALLVNISDLNGKFSANWRSAPEIDAEAPDHVTLTRDAQDEERLQLLAEHDQLGHPGKELHDRYRVLLEMEKAAERQQKRLALAEPAHAEGFVLVIDDMLYRGLSAVGAAACAGYALGSSNLSLGLMAFLPAIAGEVVTRMNGPDYLIREAMKQVRAHGQEPR